MPIRRFSGARVNPALEMTSPPSWISPSCTGSKPAMARRVVVLPQPEEPSRQTDVAGVQVQVEVLDDALLAIATGELAQVKQ